MPPCVQLQQRYFNELRRLRHVRVHDVQKCLPDGCIHTSLCFDYQRRIHTVVGKARESASKSRDDAVRRAVQWLSQLRDPCGVAVSFLDEAASVLRHLPILCFPARSPPGWFATPQIVGVDFEGQPAAIVQIACARGVVIESYTCKWVQDVLHDARHTHAIFGKHEAHMVATPYDAQAMVAAQYPQVHPHQPWSLTDAASMVLHPWKRLIKDKTIHARTDWRQCSSRRSLPRLEVRLYAALDAELTRRLAEQLSSATKPSTTVHTGSSTGTSAMATSIVLCSSSRG